MIVPGTLSTIWGVSLKGVPKTSFKEKEFLSVLFPEPRVPVKSGLWEERGAGGERKAGTKGPGKAKRPQGLLCSAALACVPSLPCGGAAAKGGAPLPTRLTLPPAVTHPDQLNTGQPGQPHSCCSLESSQCLCSFWSTVGGGC